VAIASSARIKLQAEAAAVALVRPAVEPVKRSHSKPQSPAASRPGEPFCTVLGPGRPQ